MIRKVTIAGLLLTSAVLIGGSGTAAAAAQPGIYYFHDCVGPAGTPSSFMAVKEYLPASSSHGVAAAVAFRLLDGSGVFIAHEFGDTTIGKGIPDAKLSTTCLVDFAPPNGTLPVSGFITPV